MTVSISEVLTALLWSTIAAVGVWLLTWPMRRRSTVLLLLSLTLTCAAASAGAMLGAVHSMLLPMGDEPTVLILAGVAGALTAVVAVTAARRISREHVAVRRAVDDLAHGLIPDTTGPRLSHELHALRGELHRSAAALRDSRDRELALDASRRELVAWVSHDLRTPLAGLRAMAEALEDGVADEPETYYKQIGAAVNRLTGLVDDLFDLSRIQAGALGDLSDLLSLQDIVSDLVAEVRPLASARHVTLHYEAAPSDVAVRGNPAELTRAVTNVVANAIRHTAQAQPVSVTVASSDGVARVDVADGCGSIDDAVLERIFEVGYRGSLAREAGNDDGGAGLGLAITRGILEAHGGEVSVANTARGCRFSLTLPLAPDRAPAIDGPARS